MSLRAIGLLTLAAMLAAGSAHAGEAGGKGYTLEGGVFKVPLEVGENLGVARKAWPASFGVPVPEGLVKETKDLRLLNGAGAEVPCQFRVLSRWWAKDGSLRWVLLDFQADVAAGGKSVYTLTNDKPHAPVAGGIAIEETGEAVTLSTGKLKVVVSKKRCSLFESVSLGGEELVKAAEHDGPRATTDAQDYTRSYGGDWNLHGWSGKRDQVGVHPIKRADYFGDLGAPDRVAVERKGPLHAIVRVDGAYRPTEEGKDVLAHGVYNFTYRVHVFKDKDYVRVEHSIENSRFEEPRFQTKLLDHSVWSSLAMKGNLACTYGGLGGKTGEGTAEPGKTFSVYGDKAKEGRVQWLDVAAGGKRVGVGTWLHREAQALDIVDGRLVVRPYAIYWGEAHPLSSLTSKSWGRGSFQLDFGSRETYNLWYRFGGGTDLATLLKGMTWPLFGFAPPHWYADAAVWNMDIHPDHPGKVRRRGRKADPNAAYDPQGEDAAAAAKRGKWNFNSGGHHGNLSSLNDTALVRRDLQAVQKNYWITDNAIDFLQWNYRGHEPTAEHAKLHHAHRLIMFGGKDVYLFGKKGQNMGTHMMAYKYLPDFEHYAMLWLWEHYYLWGDERARESLMRFANFSVTFEWDVMFKREGEKEGLPPLEKVDFFEKHRTGLYRSHYARIYSWQLYTPLQAYEATGHPVYDLITKWQLRRQSHLQRLSRGMPECWTRRLWDSEKQGFWKDIPYPPEADDVTAYLYRGKIWMFSKTMLAFHEAFRTYGDEEVLDNLWGMCDYYRNQVPWSPEKGTPQIPVVPQPCGNYEKEPYKLQAHMRTCQGYALAYLYTGDARLKTMMEDLAQKGGGGFTAGTWGHLYHWIKDRKGGREKPPEAVTDLACTKAARDGLVFEWTAPKGHGKSGKAARYFLKFSTKPLVKWALVANPEPPADPYIDKNKRLYKPECWHPDFLKKDAFWMATHVEGEPAPGEPGAKEKCTVTITKPHNYYGLPLEKMPKVKDLPAGTYYFALVSYDEDYNLSEPSNVVAVKLE